MLTDKLLNIKKNYGCMTLKQSFQLLTESKFSRLSFTFRFVSLIFCSAPVDIPYFLFYHCCKFVVSIRKEFGESSYHHYGHKLSNFKHIRF